MCAGVRVIKSDVSGINVMTTDAIDWKMSTTYTVKNSFSHTLADGNPELKEGSDFKVMVFENSAIALAAAATAALTLIAL